MEIFSGAEIGSAELGSGETSEGDVFCGGSETFVIFFIVASVFIISDNEVNDEGGRDRSEDDEGDDEEIAFVMNNSESISRELDRHGEIFAAFEIFSSEGNTIRNVVDFTTRLIIRAMTPDIAPSIGNAGDIYVAGKMEIGSEGIKLLRPASTIGIPV